MQVSMPNMPETLSYSVIAAVGFTVVAAIVILVAGPRDLVTAILVLAVAGGAYWLIGRNLATIVTAKEAAAVGALLLGLCALADLIVGYPYQGVLFLLAAGALAVAFFLLQQGALPLEVRFGRVVAVASSNALIHLRMLEDLRDAGILSAEEFAAKRAFLGI